ncbi:MAG: hypothetical protein ACRDHW_00145 [Ktedonobacteraceae bacterium]
MADNNAPKNPVQNGTARLTSIATEDLQSLLKLAHDLDGSIYDTASPYMKGIYTRLRSEVSKDLKKAQAAQEREVLASHRRSTKSARQAARPAAAAK